MSETEVKLNQQRTYWADKARMQLDYVMLASLEGDEKLHKEVLDDLGTSLLCLWRFDRKLLKEKRVEFKESLKNE